MIITKAIPKGPKPEEGDYKITVHFAWWPKKVKEGTIFLEKYKRVHEWRIRVRCHFISTYFYSVYAGAWDVVEEKRIMK